VRVDAGALGKSGSQALWSFEPFGTDEVTVDTPTRTMGSSSSMLAGHWKKQHMSFAELFAGLSYPGKDSER
jgi:hypothetical protein